MYLALIAIMIFGVVFYVVSTALYELFMRASAREDKMPHIRRGRSWTPGSIPAEKTPKKS